MTVDNRIVNLQFNNRQFEDNVAQSLISLEKLKKGLDFSGSTKSFSEISAASSKINFSGFGDGIDAIANKLSTMGIIGITALQRITNSAIDSGMALVKSMSTDPITTGWSKYEQKTASVQTLMNSTGLSIDEVNTHLDKLMWFSDETSYGFTDMTKALATMTSSGGDIKKLVPFITGVANATAFAGKGAAEFSRIMYNLNQSYGQGHLSMMDWRSVEMAGGASKQLTEQIIRAGKELGKLKRNSKVTTANFSTSLKDKWANRAVMERAFGYFGEMSEKAYAMVQAGEVDTATEAYAILGEKYNTISLTAAKAAQEAKTFTEAIDATKDAVSSGWMKSFDIIFGNYEEARALWTDLAYTLWDVFASGAQGRNEMLLAWKELGGRTVLLETISKLYENLSAVFSRVTKAFKLIFPSTTAEQLFNITQKFKDLISYFTMSEKNLWHLENGFMGLFGIMSMFIKGVSSGFKLIWKFLEPMLYIFDDFMALFGAFGLELLKFKKFVAISKPIETFFGTLHSIITPVISDFMVLYTNVYLTVRSMFELLDINQLTTDAFILFNKILDDMITIFGPVGSAIHGFFKDATTSVNEFRNKGLDDLNGMLDETKKKVNPFAKLFESIALLFEWIKGVYKFMEPYFVMVGIAIKDAVTGIFDSFKGAFKGWTAESFIKVINGLLTTGLLFTLQSFMNKVQGIFSGKTSLPVIKNITSVLDTVKQSMIEWQKSLVPTKIRDIANALLILAISVGILALIDPARLDKAMAAITILFAQLVIATTILSKKFTTGNDLKQMGVAVGTMIAVSISLFLLASALKKIGDIPEQNLYRGLLAIGAFILLLASSSKLLSNQKSHILETAFAMIIFSYAIRSLTKTIYKLGELDITTMAKGLGLLAAILTALSIFMHFAKSSLDSLKMDSGAGILLMAMGIFVIAKAVAVLAGIDPTKLVDAMYALGLILLSVGFFANNVGKNSSEFLQSSVGLIAMAVAINMLVASVALLGLLPVEVLIKGVGALVVLLASIAVALAVAKNSGYAAIAISAVAAALFLLVPTVMLLAALPIDAVRVALLALGGVMLILVAALAALKFIQADILLIGIGAGLLMMGTAVWMTGSGILMLVTAMGMLLAMLSLANSEMMNNLSVFSKLISSFVSSIFVGIFDAIFVSFEALKMLVINLVVSLLTAVLDFWLVFFTENSEKIKGIITVLVDILLTFIDEFLAKWAEKAPRMTESVNELFMVFLEYWEKNSDTLINQVVDTVLAFVNAWCTAIIERGPELRAAGWHIVWALITVVLGSFGDILAAGWRFISGLFTGIWTSLKEGVPKMLKAMDDFIWGLIDLVIGMALELAKWGAQGIVDLYNGIKKKADELWEKMKSIGKDLINGVISGVKGMADNITKAATNLMDDMVDGIKKFLKIKSPSRVTMVIGEYVGMGLANGLKNSASDVSSSANNLGNTAVKSLSSALSLIEIPDDDLTPVIKPVLDMDDFNKDLSSLKNNVSKGTNLDVSTTSDKASGAFTKRTKYEEEIETKSSNGQNGNTTYNVKLDGVYHIREEADIKKISKELAVEIERQRRA